jgi:hypothetical protein
MLLELLTMITKQQTREIEFDDLSKVGWITIEWVGEENIYFTRIDTGTSHFCKVPMLGYMKEINNEMD